MNAFQARLTEFCQRTDGTKDATNDFSTVINSETLIVCGNDGEMQITETSSKYHEYPPPPGIVQKQAGSITEYTTTSSIENSPKSSPKMTEQN